MPCDPVDVAEMERQLAAVKARLGSKEGDIREQDIQDWLRISVSLQRQSEEVLALADLSSFLAGTRPQESVELAQRALQLAEDNVLRANIEDSLAIAYLGLGETVRSKQHRARAIALRRDGDGPSYAGVLAGALYGTTLLAGKKLTINVPLAGIDEWLRSRSLISLSDLDPCFGEFVTNNQDFYREAKDRQEMLARRLNQRLSKPDNYLLEADPGSGKSFFVKQFSAELKKVGHEVLFLERNLSAYTSIDEVFTDIVMDLVTAFLSRRDVLLFVDEVDTQLDGKHIFQRLIAPMNGDPFFFLRKQISFSRQNLAVFYALSCKADVVEKAQKWPDFLSRIPFAHRIRLPEFNSPIDRIYRAVATLPRKPFPVTCVEAAALLYISARDWASSRELEQALELAKTRIAESSPILELAHLEPSYQDIEMVSKAVGIDIFAGSSNVVEIRVNQETQP